MSAPQAGGPAIVAARTEHLPALEALIFDHGANIWNYLPEDGIREHLDDIAQGRAHGVLALQDGQILGAVTYCLNTDFDRYLTAPLRGTPQGYVSEAVVRRDRVGQGLGTRLLREAQAGERVARRGVRDDRGDGAEDLVVGQDLAGGRAAEDFVIREDFHHVRIVPTGRCRATSGCPSG